MINLKNRYMIPGSISQSDQGIHAEYRVPIKEGKMKTFFCIASVHRRPGMCDLEHVSVRAKKGTPSWETMCVVKDLFWEDEDEVIQYHPKKSQYVNMHPNVLHMWRENHGGEEAVLERVSPVEGDSEEIERLSVSEVPEDQGVDVRQPDA